MKPRIPAPRTELAMRVYLVSGLVIGWLGIAALWWVYGWTPVLVLVGVGAMVLAGVARWVTGGGEQNNDSEP